MTGRPNLLAFLPVGGCSLLHHIGYMGKKMKVLRGLPSLFWAWVFCRMGLTLAGCGEAGDELNQEESVVEEQGDTEWVEPPLDTSDLGQDWERPAKVYVPNNYTAAEEWPLVFLLHGFTATGMLQDSYLGFSKRVEPAWVYSRGS